jgi:multiple sugar transport system substrate-binding protein
VVAAGIKGKEEKMKKLILLLAVLAMVLAACGGTPEVERPTPSPIPTTRGSSEGGQEQAGATIRFAIFDWEQASYKGLIAAFEEENPDVAVKVVSINEVLGLDLTGAVDWPEDAEQRLAAAADVVNMEASASSVQVGLVRDLTPFIEADANFQADDFYPNTLESYQWEGGTWSLPTALTFQLLFYNKEAFDEAGVAYPAPGWTWDDFVAKARALTQRQGDEVARWGFVASLSTYRLIVESHTGPLIDDSNEPPRPRFEEAEVVDAVRWLTDLYLKEQVMPYFESGDEEELMTQDQILIDNGQAAMWPEADLVWWYRNQQGSVGAAPFPVPQDDAGARTTLVWTSGLSMSSGTGQPDAAWRFIDFMSRQVIEGLGPGMQSLPARRSVAETSSFWEDLDPELAETLRYAVEHSYGRPLATAGYGAFNDALEAILKGEKGVEEALADAQTQAVADIQEQAAEEAAATPAPTVVVAPPEDETPVAAGATAITFSPGLGSLEMERYRDLAERFQEQYPEIVVEVEMADFFGGTVPDLPSMAEAADCFEWYPSFEDAKNREAILDLRPFVEADPAWRSDDFYPQALEEFTWQGQLFGLPADITPFIIEYNKDLFDAAGLDYPTVDWTWDDFVALAAALTQGEEEETKQYGFVGQVQELNDLLFFMERLGARLIDENADPPAFGFDDPATVDALRTYASLSTEYGVKPVFLTDITELMGATTMFLEREALIGDGRAAMWTGSGPTDALLGDRSELNTGAVSLPARPGIEVGTYTGASGYFISSGTGDPQACWQWITFLSEQPEAVSSLPARRSVAESEAYRQRVGAERADAYLASVAEVDRPSSFQTFSEEAWMGTAVIWLGQAYGRVVDGEATVEEALAEVQELADDLRACVIAAGDFGSETGETCAKEVDPTLPEFLFQSGE